MSIADVLTSIQDSWLARLVSKSDHMVAASLQVIHVLGFVTLLAALVLLGLRLLGWTFREHSTQDVLKDAHKLLYLGLGLTVASGVLMFVATPKLYFYKPAFQLKMLLFVAAVLVQFTVLRRLVVRDSSSTLATRATVAVSLLAWFGIGFAGRMIGFT